MAQNVESESLQKQPKHGPRKRVSPALPGRKPKAAPKPVASTHTHGHHAHKGHSQRLNRVIGQLQGIGRMLDEGRYCPEILVQTRAAMAAIKALEDSILAGHMEHCVKSAFMAKDETDIENKIEELVKLFRNRM